MSVRNVQAVVIFDSFTFSPSPSFFYKHTDDFISSFTMLTATNKFLVSSHYLYLQTGPTSLPHQSLTISLPSPLTSRRISLNELANKPTHTALSRRAQKHCKYTSLLHILLYIIIVVNQFNLLLYLLFLSFQQRHRLYYHQVPSETHWHHPSNF